MIAYCIIEIIAMVLDYCYCAKISFVLCFWLRYIWESYNEIQQFFNFNKNGAYPVKVQLLALYIFSALTACKNDVYHSNSNKSNALRKGELCTNSENNRPFLFKFVHFKSSTVKPRNEALKFYIWRQVKGGQN